MATAVKAEETTKILVAGNGKKIGTGRQLIAKCSDAKDKKDHPGVLSVSHSSDESSSSGMPDSLQKIVQAQALKVSGITIANRHDCNGIYALDGTTPGFHHHTLPYFRHISSEYYL